jgi:hypothetical protein
VGAGSGFFVGIVALASAFCPVVAVATTFPNMLRRCPYSLVYLRIKCASYLLSSCQADGREDND